MFKPTFAPLVRSGEKTQTVRPTPKRMPARGDEISLRAWSGRPYASKQIVLMEAIVDWVQRITIRAEGIALDGQPLSNHQLWSFACADGFLTPQDMLDWFNFEHGLPFEGIVIYWTPPSGGGAEHGGDDRRSDSGAQTHNDPAQRAAKGGA